MKKTLVLFGILSFLLFGCNKSPGEISGEEGLQEINGTQLYTKVIGQGEPILIIHGGPGLNHKYFLPHLEPLSQDFRLIFYDQRACGGSSRDLDSTSISLDAFIGDIEGLRKAYNIEKLNLMAHSWGGILAMEYATRYPDNIKHLILVNSIGVSNDVQLEANQRLMERFTPRDSLDMRHLFGTEEFQRMEPNIIEALMKITYRHQFYNPVYLDSLHLYINDGYAETNRLLQFLGKDFTGYDYSEKLQGINIPTLLIYGRYDPLAVLAGEPLHQFIGNSKLVIIDDSGHFPFIERPEEFQKIVTDFLN